MLPRASSGRVLAAISIDTRLRDRAGRVVAATGLKPFISRRARARSLGPSPAAASRRRGMARSSPLSESASTSGTRRARALHTERRRPHLREQLRPHRPPPRRGLGRLGSGPPRPAQWMIGPRRSRHISAAKPGAVSPRYGARASSFCASPRSWRRNAGDRRPCSSRSVTHGRSRIASPASVLAPARARASASPRDGRSAFSPSAAGSFDGSGRGRCRSVRTFLPEPARRCPATPGVPRSEDPLGRTRPRWTAAGPSRHRVVITAIRRGRGSSAR